MLHSAPLTVIQSLKHKPSGWVTQPYYDPQKNAIYFGNHQSHHLTALNEISVDTGELKKIGSLPSPSMVQVSSTAYDSENQLFFYTTNNNQLYRDIWTMNTVSRKK